MIELNSILDIAFQRAGQSSEQGSSRRTLGDCPMTLIGAYQRLYTASLCITDASSITESASS